MEEGGTGPSPEEWREFRRQLISGGIRLTTDESGSDDGGPAATSGGARKVVAPGNEALLRSQNAQLYEEYIKGSWAHESPVETGGLLLRMPLEAQLTQFLRDGTKADLLGDELRQRLRKELATLEDGGGGDKRFDSWLSNTPYCYRLCERFIAEQLGKLAAQARGGQVTVNAQSLSGSFVRLYQQANQEWQQVVLVLSSGGAGAASGVAINRPLKVEATPQLAQLLLRQTGEAGVLAPKLVEAFGGQTCVYLGGPSDQESAVLVHGVHSLDGAIELAPGTGIYTGGERAAIEAVRSGAASPLDFRWFIGRHTSLEAGDGRWRAVACARPVALKQCLGLPKPLWHEVMELCGGECATLSRLEILKREDLPEDG
jgi:hypothetical protein